MPRSSCDLVIDAGNTRIKAALFNDFGPLERVVVAPSDLSAIDAFVADRAIGGVVLGSVAGATAELVQHLSRHGHVLEVTGATPSPLKSAYDTPETLGADRIANAVGAWQRFPGRPPLAIDLGTCITYDVVDGSGTYRGGIISPGLRMRARAMHAYSARLPEVVPSADAPLLGRSTESSLASGVYHGIRAELVGLVQETAYQHPGLAVVLTGGDAPLFLSALKSGIFADPLLTLRGLHALLQHHTRGRGPVAP